MTLCDIFSEASPLFHYRREKEGKRKFGGKTQQIEFETFKMPKSSSKIKILNNSKPEYFEADTSGNIIIPENLASGMGISPGERVKFVKEGNAITLRLPMRLSKLYIEPTNLCNLNCRTCIRHIWNEPSGMMSEETFEAIIKGIDSFPSLPDKVFFGGFGEPLFHPKILDMISLFKSLGMKAELITNGTLLKEDMIKSLIDAELDTMWISLDGSTPESFSDIRMGAELPNILENLTLLRRLNGGSRGFKQHMEIGVVFVAMKRNIAELPAVIEIATSIGASRMLVTNVLPYTKEMVKEPLYYNSINRNNFKLDLPLMDMDDTILKSIQKAKDSITMTIPFVDAEKFRNRCPFIEEGAGAIGWDGNLSPCLALLHSHDCHLNFLNYNRRHSKKWAIGNVLDKDLFDLWNTPEHRAFRERVLDYDFAPCITCGGCDLSQSNEEDCIGNQFPTCGACLWGQGIIRCP